MQKNNPKKWDNLYATGAKYRPLNQIFLDRLIKKIEKLMKKKIKTVIDLGCGTGDAIAQFEKRGYKSIGIDFSAVAIAKAKEKNSNARFIEHDLNSLQSLDVKKGTNLICCKLTIAFIKNKNTFFREVKKLMNDNSVFCLITPVLHDDIDYNIEDKPGIAVNYKTIKNQLQRFFKTAIEFDNEYVGEKNHIVTFLIIK